MRTDDNYILGQLTREHGFALDDLQRNSWLTQIAQLKELLAEFPRAYIFFEFVIPRMGKRADIILVMNGMLLVLEYKVGTKHYDNHSIEQTIDYALDLKNFHEGSHDKIIIPILVATDAEPRHPTITFSDDQVASVICANKENLKNIIYQLIGSHSLVEFDAGEWSSSFLEDVATEFDIQGLELDWIGVCWGADLRYDDNSWSMNKFSGSKWQQVNAEERQRYLLNAYRVLLTRARQGMVIFVPEGDEIDHTRLPEFYNTSYEYLRSLNIPTID